MTLYYGDLSQSDRIIVDEIFESIVDALDEIGAKPKMGDKADKLHASISLFFMEARGRI